MPVLPAIAKGVERHTNLHQIALGSIWFLSSQFLERLYSHLMPPSFFK
ncbi:hypothetical protein [Scytonema hofmannii]|nr:hypothetical protein [Scytonema hofmannii]